MKAFKALLMKDLNIYKKTIMIPVWIVLVLFVINLTITGIAIANADVNVFQEIKEVIAENRDLATSDQMSMISYVIGVGSALGVALLGLIASITASQSALNHNRQAKCEGFYRLLPVSDWFSNLSIYAVTIFGSWLVAFGVGLVILIFNFILSLFFISLNFPMMFLGFFQYFLNFMIPSLLVASVTYLFSGIFENKAILKLILLYLVTRYAFFLLQMALNISIPEPIYYLFKPIGESFRIFSALEQLEISNFSELKPFITESWGYIFNLRNVLYLGLNAAFFAGATYIKRLKDVK